MNHAGGDFIGHHHCSQRAVQYSELLFVIEDFLGFATREVLRTLPI